MQINELGFSCSNSALRKGAWKYVFIINNFLFVLYLHTKLTILCNNIHIVLIFISSKTTSLDNKRPRSQVQILTKYFQATAQNI